MNDTTKDITQLFPSGKTITLKGKEFLIKPFGFGKFPKVLSILKDIDVSDVPEDTVGLKTVNVAKILSNNAEKVVELCSLATGEKMEWFDDLLPDEGVELCQAIIEVNADFFISRLQPKLLGALSQLSKSVGGLLSQGSLQTATDSKTSSTTR